MKIVLIGASGFVGTRLLGLLGETPEKFNLKNIDKQQSHFFPQITEIGDVRNVHTLTEKIKGADVVVLLAAEHRDDVSPVSLYYDVNVGGMKNVLQAMESNGIRRIVFTSSVAVYGLNKDMRSIQQIHSIIMGRANGRLNRSFRSGISHTRIGISTFSDLL